MIRKKNFHRVVAGVISAMLFSSLSGVSALAASKKNNLINIQHSYTNNGYTFEKISHASEGTETADGVVDYLGNHNIEAYIDGEIEELPLARKEDIGRTVDFASGRNRYIGYLISIPSRDFKNV